MVEIPGLIRGAASGAGLGHEFLKHAERTRAIWHLVDGCHMDVLDRVSRISQELRLFSHALAEKPQIVVINKMDVTEAAEIRKELGIRLSKFLIELRWPRRKYMAMTIHLRN